MLKALYIVLGGMAIIFACMGMVLLAMMLMGKLLRTKGTEGETKEG